MSKLQHAVNGTIVSISGFQCIDCPHLSELGFDPLSFRNLTSKETSDTESETDHDEAIPEFPSGTKVSFDLQWSYESKKGLRLEAKNVQSKTSESSDSFFSKAHFQSTLQNLAKVLKQCNSDSENVANSLKKRKIVPVIPQESLTFRDLNSVWGNQSEMGPVANYSSTVWEQEMEAEMPVAIYTDEMGVANYQSEVLRWDEEMNASVEMPIAIYTDEAVAYDPTLSQQQYAEEQWPTVDTIVTGPQNLVEVQESSLEDDYAFNQALLEGNYCANQWEADSGEAHWVAESGEAQWEDSGDSEAYYQWAQAAWESDVQDAPMIHAATDAPPPGLEDLNEIYGQEGFEFSSPELKFTTPNSTVDLEADSDEDINDMFCAESGPEFTPISKEEQNTTLGFNTPPPGLEKKEKTIMLALTPPPGLEKDAEETTTLRAFSPPPGLEKEEDAAKSPEPTQTEETKKVRTYLNVLLKQDVVSDSSEDDSEDEDSEDGEWEQNNMFTSEDMNNMFIASEDFDIENYNMENPENYNLGYLPDFIHTSETQEEDLDYDQIAKRLRLGSKLQESASSSSDSSKKKRSQRGGRGRKNYSSINLQTFDAEKCQGFREAKMKTLNQRLIQRQLEKKPTKEVVKEQMEYDEFARRREEKLQSFVGMDWNEM